LYTALNPSHDGDSVNIARNWNSNGRALETLHKGAFFQTVPHAPQKKWQRLRLFDDNATGTRRAAIRDDDLCLLACTLDSGASGPNDIGRAAPSPFRPNRITF